jgi:neutral amino acid transport system permease protein
MVETGLANAVVTGLVTGSIVALGAIGLALVYTIAEVPNFAHGELLTLGAYIALFVNLPGTVPVFEVLADGPRSLTTPGFAVLFAMAAGSSLAAVYFLGGQRALEGSWWPVDAPPTVALAVHGLLAAGVGALVVAWFPSIWAGLVLAMTMLAWIGPVLETTVFRKFRNKGVTLATMLIVTLGLSFVLRYSLQAVYGGENRSYAIPDAASLFDVELGLGATRFFDFYATGRGVILQVTDTGPEPNIVNVTVGMTWLLVAIAAIAAVAAAYAAARLRSGEAEGYTESKTFGPRLSGTVAGVAAFAVAAILLAGPTDIPESAMYSTRISLSLLRGSVIVIALLMILSLHLLLQETKLGTAMRAASDNMDLAKVTGINTDRVMMATWIIAGAFAGVGGVMLGVLFNVINTNTGFFLLLPMFAGVILGGIGSVYGSILGSFVVGIAMDVGIWAIPDIGATYRVPIAFGVLFVVLLVKPEGITGGS